MTQKNHETNNTSSEKRIIEKYPKLAEACSKYPRKVLGVRGRAYSYKQPQGYAKDGFVEKFCRY